MTEKLKTIEKLGYGVGDAACNFIWMPLVYFQIYFYTDVFGINPATVGAIILAVRVFDTINDPLMGAIADRTRTRFGRYRPFLIIGAVPLGILAFLVFTVPELSQEQKEVYAFVSLLLLSIFYTIVNVPYSSLMGAITDDASDRASLASIRFVGAFIAGAIVLWFTPDLVKYLGQGDEAQGYQYTMMIYGGLLILALIFTFATTRERVEPTSEPITLRQDFKNLFKNKPFWALFATGICTLSFNSIRGGVTVHYFKYVIEREDLVGLFLVSGTFATIAGIVITKYLTSKFDKTHVYIASMLLGALCYALTYFLSPADTTLIFSLHILGAFLSAPTIPIVWLMYADIVEYSEDHTGARSNGLIFAGGSFSQKMGWSIGGALVGFLLQGFGFVANSAQPASSLEGMHLMFTLIPAGLALVAVSILFLFYHLNNSRMKQVYDSLNGKRLVLSTNE